MVVIGKMKSVRMAVVMVSAWSQGSVLVELCKEHVYVILDIGRHLSMESVSLVFISLFTCQTHNLLKF